MIKGKQHWVEQRSLAEGFIGDWRAVVPENSFEKTIFNWAMASLSPADFKSMFKSIRTGRGRTPVEPFKTLLAMVYAFHYNLSDRLLERDTVFNLAAKVACGLDLTESIDAVTLCRHRALFLEFGGTVLRKTVDALRATGLVAEANLVILDSYAVTDACATMDTYILLRTAILRLVTEIALTEFAIEIDGHLLRDDYKTVGKADIDWNKDEAKRLLLKELYEDARYLLSEVEKKAAETRPESVVACAALLAKIIAQNIRLDDKGEPFIPKGVAPDRILSTVDTESRHGRKACSKKIDGYKSHIITDGEVVLDVDVTAANVPDGNVALALVDGVVEQGIEVEVALADGAYGTTEIIHGLQDRGIEPIVKITEPVGKGDFFSKGRFNIDLTAMSCTCPAGVTTYKLHSSQSKVSVPEIHAEGFVLKHLTPPSAAGTETDVDEPEATESEGEQPHQTQFFRFSPKTCLDCPLREQCTSSKSGRTVRLHYDEKLMQERRELQDTPEFKESYRRRSWVERVNSELVRHGGRVGRYMGRAKNLFQQELVGAAHNLAVMARRLAEPTPEEPKGALCPVS